VRPALALLAICGALLAEGPPRLSQVNDFGYQLQKIDPDAIAASTFDLVVVDPSRDGSDEGRWTSEEMTKIRGGAGGPRLALAYLSYGEAEDYRGYWQKGQQAGSARWKPGAPAWLGEVNPNWEGNYPVRFWEPAWQEIMFGKPTCPLDVILSMGFDGVYLDVIDSYQVWEKQGVKDASKRAVEAVLALSRYAKSKRAGFLVFVQNAAELGASKAYRDAVDGIGREDMYFEGDDVRDAGERTEAEAELDRFAGDGKPVLVVEYCRAAAHVRAVYTEARKRKYIPYCTVRALDALTVNSGFEPD